MGASLGWGSPPFSPRPREPRGRLVARATGPFAGLRDHGVVVVRAPGGGRLEELPALHPAVRALVHVARVGLEDDPLAGAEAAHVDARAQILGQLAQPVVLVALRLEVDLALGVTQGAEV